MQYVRHREAHADDTEIPLTQFTHYSVKTYMHYIMNADIHIYEKQAYRFAKGEVNDYMALLRDTVNLISEEEIKEIKVEVDSLRHSSRISTNRHASVHRIVNTRLSESHFRKPVYTPPRPPIPRKRAHTETVQTTTMIPQQMTSERFWKIIETNYYRSPTKISHLVTPLLLSQEPISFPFTRDVMAPLFSWTNPSLPSSTSTAREIK